MSSTKDFRDYVVGDLLSGAEGISSRAMFGGFGLYRGGKVFAFILANELYLKAQGEDREELERLGGRPFTYRNPKGKLVTMPYTVVPAMLLEDRTALSAWVYRITN